MIVLAGVRPQLRAVADPRFAKILQAASKNSCLVVLWCDNTVLKVWLGFRHKKTLG